MTETNVGTTVTAPHAAAAEVERVERSWVRAEVGRDRATIERILDADVIATHFTGMVGGHREVLASIMDTPMPLADIRLEELRVMPLGESAVVTGRALITAEGRPDAPVPFRYMRVYAKRSDGWKLVATQVTPELPRPGGSAEGSR